MEWSGIEQKEAEQSRVEQSGSIWSRVKGAE